MLKTNLLLIATAGLLMACGESDAPQEKAMPQVAEQAVVEAPVEVAAVAEETVVETVTQLPAEVGEMPVAATTEEAVYLPSQLVTQEEIYKNWPYTEAPAATPAALTESVVEAVTEAVTEEVAAVVGDKPYQLVEGKISENAMNGWRTYNGGGCGTCHGKGGIGAVGPDLANSAANVLSKEEFLDVVTNGRSGTMMRPHKTNKRVMDNIEDLYVYLLARGDGVLGPGNLIKMPLGK